MKHRALRVMIFYIFVGTVVYFLFSQLIKEKIISPLPDKTGISTMAVESVTPTEIPTPTPRSDGLKIAVEKALEGTKGTYGVVIKNLKSNESYYLNEDRTFDTASLYKLWIMAVVYQWIQDGKLTEDQVLREDVGVLNSRFDIDPAYAELTEGTVVYTVNEALEKMITISHNYAAMLLTWKIRLSTVADFLTEYGFNESSVGITGGLPKSTASDIALFFEKLYNGELADNLNTQKMITLLKDQTLNNGLPRYLPDILKIAHKTGELGAYKHDAGIVFTDEGDYIIVVLSESNSQTGAQDRIASVSKEVYTYFTQNP